MEDVAMLMLLRAFHPIAARQGDGLRPELVRLLSGGPSTGSLQPTTELQNEKDTPDTKETLSQRAAGTPPVPTKR
jgi:hypothetical protein